VRGDVQGSTVDMQADVCLVCLVVRCCLPCGGRDGLERVLGLPATLLLLLLPHSTRPRNLPCQRLSDELQEPNCSSCTVHAVSIKVYRGP
jgi:hypothetical protein